MKALLSLLPASTVAAWPAAPDRPAKPGPPAPKFAAVRPPPLQDPGDSATLDRWAAPYRGWYYWPDPVVPARPVIGAVTNLLATDVPTISIRRTTPSTCSTTRCRERRTPPAAGASV